jgi:Fe-S cluster assembly ATP-binding protein
MKLEIKDLTVMIENKIILDKFNLLINDGEIHTIMGPNGVGKSTLSRVIMGDDRYKIINGDILADDESIINKTTDERSRLGIFLSMQQPMEIEGVSNQDFLRTAISNKNNKKINLYEFVKEIEKSVEELKMNKELIHRSLNVGFSGGEKKKNEVLQIKLLKPSLIILDELDSGLDVDSLKIVCENIISYKKEHPNTAILIITHYKMILDYLVPNYVHILSNKKIVKTGDANLIKDIEKNGYTKYTSKLAGNRNDANE